MDGVVLASPENYKLTKINSVVDPKKAMEQFQRLKGRLESQDIPVHIIDSKVDPEGKYPDFVYVSNSALILRGWPTKVAILARFAHPERRGEEERVGAYLKHILGYKVISLPEREGLYFEGQGDTRWSNEGHHLWMCYGAGRTTLAGIDAVREVIMREAAAIGCAPPKFHRLQMVEKITCHLDLCLLPLPNGRTLFHGSSFSPASKKEIENHFGKTNIINVPLKYLYACNSVWLDENTLLIPKLPDCRQWMYAATKMKIIEVNLNEFHLAGGSASCMVLPLWSQI
jgi:N-dimethylarginine dimethylaminohydrolase